MMKILKTKPLLHHRDHTVFTDTWANDDDLVLSSNLATKAHFYKFIFL